jgi:excisionase family DNA binding protein
MPTSLKIALRTLVSARLRQDQKRALITASPAVSYRTERDNWSGKMGDELASARVPSGRCPRDDPEPRGGHVEFTQSEHAVGGKDECTRENVPLLTPEQAAAELGISRDTLRDMRRAGEIPYVNIGRGRNRETPQYDLNDLIRWKERTKIRACPSSSEKTRKTVPIATTSKSAVADFLAIRENRTRREAQKVEKAKRQEVKALLFAEADLFASEMTLLVACARYWQEVGQHHRNSDTTQRHLDWLTRHFGDDRLLHEIDDNAVAAMVAKRRGEFVRTRRKRPVTQGKRSLQRRVSDATVNRTATQPLREIVLRARDVWGVKTSKINWAKHLLPAPQERVREASPAEERAIMAELARGYDVAVEFAFINGCRRMEILGLEWTRVDFFNRRFTVIGKGGRRRSIGMTQRTFEILWSQQGYHPQKVFTYVAQRTVKMRDGRLLCRGKRYPLTEAGLKTAFRRAVPNAGVKDFRFHDTRHTTATRVLRKSNLRVVQRLLAGSTRSGKFHEKSHEEAPGIIQSIEI